MDYVGQRLTHSPLCKLVESRCMLPVPGIVTFASASARHGECEAAQGVGRGLGIAPLSRTASQEMRGDTITKQPRISTA